MSEDDKNNLDNRNINNDGFKQLLLAFLKVLGIFLAVVLLIVVVGFGLLVGFCALGR